ncbi:CAMK family protein kinase [Tritrichomonas foetus]|uniref:CAMK family protein kinase n=1 Tax=Tritrichomonas foetus TaxID=1144522 RepID=A0A1J4K980_9EUKA|nr:CAMK family protein kinase [Tritrichomonas foetus]|eukprot:OHT07498.1 CAMK family protein kinase [Tritrichomonas foetus]
MYIPLNSSIQFLSLNVFKRHFSMYSGGFPLPDIDFDDFDLIPIDNPIPNSSPKTMRPNTQRIMEKFGFTPLSGDPLKCTSNSMVYKALSLYSFPPNSSNNEFDDTLGNFTNYDTFIPHDINVIEHNNEYDSNSLDSNKIFAIKLSSNKMRLFHEFQNSQKLGKSPYFVQVYDIYEDETFAMLQMEICEGGDLFGSVLHESLIWLMIHDVCCALYQIHSSGYIHLDVSPSNILRSKYYFKLADYGTLLEEGEFGPGKEGAGPYASPETLNFPSVPVDYQTDIFSLGVVLLEASSGFFAPRGGDKKYELLRKGELKLGEHGYKSNVSDELVNIVNAMLEPDANRRPTAFFLLHHPYVVAAHRHRMEILSQSD